MAVLVVAGSGLGVYFGTRSDSAAVQASSTTQTVSTGTIRQSVSASGTLAPAQQKSLTFSVAGTVTAVRVAEGDRVRKGQVLATVDSASAASTVAQARATVASARAQVDSDATNSASSTQTNADKAALKAARNQLASAKKQLHSTTMRSPIDGIVAEVNVSVGDSVSGSASSASNSNASSSFPNTTSSSSSSSTAQILVISRSSWIVNATVDATSVALIKVGNQAQLTIDGASATLYGTIASIGLVSSSTSGTASYPVVIGVTGAQAGLRDGASVTATLIYKQLSNVVVISSLALHRDSQGAYVDKVVNGKTVEARVQTGISSGGQTQITSGLKAGDHIRVPQVTLGTGNGGSGTNRTGNFPGGSFPGGSFPGGNFPGGNFPGGGGGG